MNALHSSRRSSSAIRHSALRITASLTCLTFTLSISACQGQFGSAEPKGGGGSAGIAGRPTLDDKDSLYTPRPVGSKAPFEPNSATSAAYRVKNLPTGELPTQSELEALSSGSIEFKAQVTQWVDEAGFDLKLLPFLMRYLGQKADLSNTDLSLLVRGSPNGPAGKNQKLSENLREALARGILAELDNGGDFSAVFSQRRIMATTAVLQFLTYTDPPHRKDFQYTFYTNNRGAFPANPSVAQMIQNNAWKIPGLSAECDGISSGRKDFFYGMLLGTFSANQGDCKMVSISMLLTL